MSDPFVRQGVMIVSRPDTVAGEPADEGATGRRGPKGSAKNTPNSPAERHRSSVTPALCGSQPMMENSHERE